MSLKALTINAPAAGTYQIGLPKDVDFLGYGTNNTPSNVRLVLPDGQYIPLPRNAPNYSVPGKAWRVPAGSLFWVVTGSGTTTIAVFFDDNE